MMGLAAMVACDPVDDTQTVEPVFPTEPYENYEVVAGSVESFTITPNLEWEISIPAKDIQWFWLAKENDDQKYSKLSGEASEEPIEILVGVNETEEFNENRSVEVTLTMGGQSKVVAKLMRPAKARVLKVYAATIDDWGFVPAEGTDETYTYTSEPVTSLTLAWPEDKSGFMVPIKVEANFDWVMEYPEWVKYVAPADNYGKAGVVEMRFDGVPSKYPVAGATSKVVIKAADDESYTQELDIVIPACNDRISFGLGNSVADPLTFNAAGQYNSAYMGFTDGPAGAFINATKNSRVFAVEWNSEWEAYDTKEASWVNIFVSAWDETAGADVLQDREVEISVEANESQNERKAVIFFLPESVTVDLLGLFNDQGTVILEQYQKYALELTQEAKAASAGGYITMQSTPAAMAEVGAAFEVSTEIWLPGMFNAPAESSYKLTYSLAWSRDEAWMNFAEPYTSVEIYNMDGNRISGDALENYWLQLTGMTGNSEAVVDMNTETYNEGFVKFLGADGETLAVVWCVFDPDFSPSGEGGESSGSVEFIGETAGYASMVGASLEQITSGDIYNQYAEYGCPIYSLTYSSFMAQTMPMSISTPAYTMAIVNPTNMSDYFWQEGTAGGATIYMQVPDEIPTATATMLFYGADYSVVLVLVCNWAPVQ